MVWMDVRAQNHVNILGHNTGRTQVGNELVYCRTQFVATACIDQDCMTWSLDEKSVHINVKWIGGG